VLRAKLSIYFFQSRSHNIYWEVVKILEELDNELSLPKRFLQEMPNLPSIHEKQEERYELGIETTIFNVLNDQVSLVDL